MATNTADSMEGPGRRAGWPIGWIVLSWVVVGLAAYWLATWLNRSAPQTPTPAEQNVKAVATAPAPVAAPAAASANPAGPEVTQAPAPRPALRSAALPATEPAPAERAAPFAPLAALPAPAAQAPASTPVVKCVIHGVVTFSDEPCSAVASGKPKTGGQTVAARPARIERKITCEGHEDAIRQIDLQAGTTLNASELEGLALRRKQHRDEQFRMRC